MKITRLAIKHFRNLMDVDLSPSEGINLFYGHNGSGKTSLLEAIHYLGLGRSFRTRNIRRLIHDEASAFSLFCPLADADSGTLPIGIERTKESQSIKIAGNVATSLVELAELLPLQLINADSHLLLGSGPRPRRQFLDWGVFHVEHQFFSVWQRTNRVIKQRNANLKQARSYKDIQFWDEELESGAEWLHQHRLKYLELYNPLFQAICHALLDEPDLKLHYQPGWNVEQGYQASQQEAFEREKFLGYTQQGPHRADLQLKVHNVTATEILSQGQQKLATYALRLAQGKLLQQQTNKRCIFLIDDLPSELDPEKRRRVCQYLAELDSQLFITGIEPEMLADLAGLGNAKMFHVEHGSIFPA